MSKTCLFCKIIMREVSSRIVFENNEILAFEDIRPQAPVHIIIIPKQHIEKMSDLNGKDRELAGNLLLAAKDIARQRDVHDSGYRIVVNCNRDAGQAVPHLHLHLLGGRVMTWPPG